MTCSTVYFLCPLIHQYTWQNHQRAPVFQEINDDETDGHDGFAEPHFVGDESPAHIVEWRLSSLTGGAPFQPVILVLLVVNPLVCQELILLFRKAHV